MPPGGRRILIALRAVRRARVEYALGKREEWKRDEGKREEGRGEQGRGGSWPVWVPFGSHLGGHLGAIWGVIWGIIWESFPSPLGGPKFLLRSVQFGSSSGANSPLPRGQDCSKKRSSKSGSMRCSEGSSLGRKAPRKRPPMRAIRTQKTARMGGWGSWVMSHRGHGS